MDIKLNKDVAFVTAYLDIYHDINVEISRNRGIEWRLKTFQPLADTGITLYLFYSQVYASYFENEEFQKRNPNVIPVQVIELEDTWTWNIAQTYQPLQLPEERNEKKDTFEYMILQNAKQEFIEKVMDKYPGKHMYYSWIDFSIVHMFKYPESSLEYIRVCYGNRSQPRISTHYPDSPSPSPFFIPGCWSQRWHEPDPDAVLKRIHWRFCGSFFIACAESMRNFIRLYRHCFPLFMKEHKRMIWEVNFWAWIEVTGETLLEKYPLENQDETDKITPWNPTWYHADHNDTIYRAPYWAFNSQPLMKYENATVELLKLAPNLPPDKQVKDDQEWMGSSCFTYSTTYGPLLNTRVMNYWLYPNGYYRFIDPKHIIRTRNLLSSLDENGQPIQTYAIEEQLGELVVQHYNPEAFSQGLEDIRIWVSPSSSSSDSAKLETLRFIATNVNYSPVEKGRMMTGTLDIQLQNPNTATETPATEEDEEEKEKGNAQEWKPVFKDAVSIDPPSDTYTEKNWIPLILETGELGTDKEHFIYQWSPYQLGNIHYPSYDKDLPEFPRPKLEIHTVIQSQNPFLFERIRGSSPFIPFPPTDAVSPLKYTTEKWLGVAHFSDESCPRKYSHVLISLDQKGIPVRYSAPFAFCSIGVEFCIGFHAFQKEQETYVRFWISRHDREPTVVTLPFRHMALDYHFSPLEKTPEFEAPPLVVHRTVAQRALLDFKAPIIPQTLTNMPTTPIHLFILCYNEELILPHTLRHYRTYLPHAYITLYDNESTDRSREIAEEWGCRVVVWSSGNQQNEYIQQNIKNDAWKSATPFHEIQIDPRPECSGRGWKLIVDMDEWVVVTEAQLAEEEALGTTLLRIKGVNIIGQSQDVLLADVTPQVIQQWNRVVDWKSESKNLCFLSPPIENMNYTRGAHACKPEGERVKYSHRVYYNKHMENFGLEYLIRKFTLRKQRNRVMQERSINLHYTDDVNELTRRFTEMKEKSYVLSTFDPIIPDAKFVLETDYHYV